MNFVHSFWSKPLIESKFNSYEKQLNIVLTDYALSAAYIKSNGHSIRLFADKLGAELLSFIPYDEVVIVDVPKDLSVHFAAQIKFEALKRMRLDECLIDGDLFIRRPEAFERISSLDVDFVYSFYEPNTFILNTDLQISKYKYMREQMNKVKSQFTGLYKLDKDMSEYEWTNTSLMLFHNQQLKDEYIRQYEFYRKLLNGIDFGFTWPDIIIEQRHMTKLLSTGYTSEPVIENFPTSFANMYAKSIGFHHLGGAKGSLHYIIQSWLEEQDKDLYDKVQEQTTKYLFHKFN